MQIDKEQIDSLIKNFEEIKDTIKIDEKNLVKFDTSKSIDREFLSFTDGRGGYYMKFLHYMVSTLKPTTVVELGNREGLSTLCIYNGMKELHESNFYTVDIEKDQRYCPPAMFSDKRIHFLFGDVCSTEIVTQIPRNIDLLFSDTIHFDHQIRDEFEIYQHLLADTALVAIDDIKLNDKGLLFESLPYDKWDLTELCHASGWGLFLFKRNTPLTETDKVHNLKDSMLKVWERKYKKLYEDTRNVESQRIGGRIKNTIKQITPIYKIYTGIFNFLAYKFRGR